LVIHFVHPVKYKFIITKDKRHNNLLNFIIKNPENIKPGYSI